MCGPSADRMLSAWSTPASIRQSCSAAPVRGSSCRNRAEQTYPPSPVVLLPRLSAEHEEQPMTAGTMSPWPLVRKGDQQHPVKTLQYLLRARGHNLTVDGIFGPNTDAAVRAFQQQKGLAVDGIVGPNTWSALIITVKQGSQGDAVRGVQEGSSSATCPAIPVKDCRSTGSSAPRPTPPCVASSRPSIRTSRRSPSTASSARSPGGRSSAACCPSSNTPAAWSEPHRLR
jgi:hypothetical protein